LTDFIDVFPTTGSIKVAKELSIGNHNINVVGTLPD
jgi:hypothetical protein